MIERSICHSKQGNNCIHILSKKKKDKDKQYNNKKNVWYILSESKKEKKKVTPINRYQKKDKSLFFVVRIPLVVIQHHNPPKPHDPTVPCRKRGRLR